MAVEIADAYVSLIVKMDQPQKRIEGELGKVDSDGAGQKIGFGLSGGISKASAAIAGAIGGIFASITTAAVSGLSDLFGQAVMASDATDKFAQTLSFAGLDTSAIDTAMSKSRAYADSTVYDLSTIQNTTAQLAANGIANFSDLTEAAGNLNAVAGGNQETFKSVAMMLTQTAGAGKLTTENWNQLSDAIPGAAGVLMNAMLNAGAYTGNFRDAMEQGQITAEEFNAAITQVGSQPIAAEAAKSTETFEGAIGNLQAVIVGGLSDALNAVKPALTGFIDGVANFVSFIRDNVSWIGPLAAGITAAAVAMGVYTAAMGIYGAYATAAAAAEGGLTVAQWLLNAAMNANPIGLIIVAIGLLIGAIILLVMNWDTVVKWISSVWDGFISWVTQSMLNFAAGWNLIWTSITQFVQGLWDGFIQWVTQSLVNFVTGWNAIWAGVGAFIQAIWNDWIVNPIRTATTWMMSLIMDALFTINRVWNDVWNGLVGIVRDVWNGILGWIEGGVNGAIDLINGMTAGANVVLGTVGVQIGEIPHIGIPRLAAGGVVQHSSTGTLALIGEGGRDEAVIPLPENWRRDGFGGDRPGATVNQYLTITHPDPRIAVRQLAREAGRAFAAT